MPSSTPIAGYGQVNVAGTIYPFDAELKWNFLVFEKKMRAGRDGNVRGPLLTPNVPYIEGTFTFDGSYTSATLEAIANATISVTLATGMQLVLTGASVAGPVEPDGDEGQVKLRFEGATGQEI
jgi:Phage tail tube protein